MQILNDYWLNDLRKLRNFKEGKSPNQLITIINTFGINEVLSKNFKKSSYFPILKPDKYETSNEYLFNKISGKYLIEYLNKKFDLLLQKKYILYDLHRIIKYLNEIVYDDEAFQYNIKSNEYGLLCKKVKLSEIEK